MSLQKTRQSPTASGSFIRSSPTKPAELAISQFFFYDLETSGLNARADRIMQFAGRRTDTNLEPIGEPVNLLVKLTDDTLPSPYAIRATGITPQQTLADGITEADLAQFISKEVFTPDTITVGYNNIRFDDEFIRNLFWRTFHDPYEWAWSNGRSRWDLLDVIRLTRALRPEGINWPVDAEGHETNRLELITKLNGISHQNAHDALADVDATIDVARILKAKQPQLFNFLLKLRDKRAVYKYVNLDDKKPFVYSSGRYESAHHKTSVAFPLAPARNGSLLVFDLRYNLNDLDQAGNLYPIVKEFSPNRCPAIAPISVLDRQDGWSKIELDYSDVETNLQALIADSSFAERMRASYENRPDFPPAPDPESALYDGFLGDPDRRRLNQVNIASANINQLADLHPSFDDPRLPELFLHFRARNFPQALSADEQQEWETYRRSRLASQSPIFIRDLQTLSKDSSFDPHLAEELRLWHEAIMPTLA